jgi:hypothetical protein
MVPRGSLGRKISALRDLVLIQESSQVEAIKQRQQPALQTVRLGHVIVVLPEILEIAVGLVLAPRREPRPRLDSVRVIVALVGHDGPSQDVVGHNEAAGAEDTVGRAWLRLLEDRLQVGGVARLLGIDEDEVKWLVGLEVRKTVCLLVNICSSGKSKQRRRCDTSESLDNNASQ